jgi:signal transduction histidine kinase
MRGIRQGNDVRYEVQDTGVGISPEDQARLFEKFSRLNTVKVEGLGLGLSIVRRMVGKLRGQVGVESVLGKGSTFWFRLPAAMPDWQESEPRPVALPSTGRLSPRMVEIQRNR